MHTCFPFFQHKGKDSPHVEATAVRIHSRVCRSSIMHETTSLLVATQAKSINISHSKCAQQFATHAFASKIEHFAYMTLSFDQFSTVG